jgi:hypothetical protein
VGCHRLPYYGVSCAVHQVIGHDLWASEAPGELSSNTVAHETGFRDRPSSVARTELRVRRGTSSGFRCRWNCCVTTSLTAEAEFDALPMHGGSWSSKHWRCDWLDDMCNDAAGSCSHSLVGGSPGDRAGALPPQLVGSLPRLASPPL